MCRLTDIWENTTDSTHGQTGESKLRFVKRDCLVQRVLRGIRIWPKKTDNLDENIQTYTGKTDRQFLRLIQYTKRQR